MPDAHSSDITELLLAVQGGAPDAVSKLMPVVYAELNALAAGYLRAEPAVWTPAFSIGSWRARWEPGRCPRSASRTH